MGNVKIPLKRKMLSGIVFKFAPNRNRTYNLQNLNLSIIDSNGLFKLLLVLKWLCRIELIR